MVTLDTSALIRFFTNDIPVKAEKVKKVLENKEEIRISDVVFPELEYVLLGKSYNATRKKLIEAFDFLLLNKNIKLSEEFKKAVDVYKSTKLDMADCIIVASSLDNTLLSFDSELLFVKGVKEYQPQG